MQKQISLEVAGQDLVPPQSNTGAQSTGQRILIDWFAFTLPYSADIYQVLNIPADEWVCIDTRALGYTRMYLHGAMKVYMSEREDMGVHCELSGAACREYEFWFGSNWSELITKIRSVNGTFSRIDIAIDDFDGIFTLDQIEHKVKSGQIISYFRRGRILEEFNLNEKDNLGKTIYFGAAQSRIKIRMYNKAIEQLLKEQQSRETEVLEQESKHKLPSNLRKENKRNREEIYRQERLNFDQVWNRTEIQARDERAEVIADYIQGNMPVGEIAFGVLKHYLNFLEPSDTDSNKSRWPVSEFWTKFLGIVEELKLTIEKRKKTLSQVREWVVRQVAPSLALLSMDKTLKLDLEKICEITIFAKNRLTKRHLALLQTS